jgi:hypothetical protein
MKSPASFVTGIDNMTDCLIDTNVFSRIFTGAAKVKSFVESLAAAVDTTVYVQTCNKQGCGNQKLVTLAPSRVAAIGNSSGREPGVRRAHPPRVPTGRHNRYDEDGDVSPCWGSFAADNPVYQLLVAAPNKQIPVDFDPQPILKFCGAG